MKKIGLSIICVVLLFAAGTTVFGQDAPAKVIYGEGYGFNLLREGEELYFDILYDDVIGFELHEGDYISTDEETFLEIQLTSSSNVLKISENTSFQITQVSGKGGGDFALTYGRVRAKVKRLIGDDEFSIGGPSAVAGVRGTDFGYDVIVMPDMEKNQIETVAQVYCFDGKVEVTQAEKEDAEEEIVIESNQMVTFSAEEDTELVKEDFEPRHIDEEINVFWDRYDFTGELIEYPPIEDETDAVEKKPESKDEKIVEKKEEKTPEVEPSEEKEEINFELEQKKAKARRNFFIAGTTVIGVGALTELTGILLYFFGADWFNGDAQTYRQAGTVCMVAGGGIALGGLLTYIGILVNK